MSVTLNELTNPAWFVPYDEAQGVAARVNQLLNNTDLLRRVSSVFYVAEGMAANMYNLNVYHATVVEDADSPLGLQGYHQIEYRDGGLYIGSEELRKNNPMFYVRNRDWSLSRSVLCEDDSFDKEKSVLRYLPPVAPQPRFVEVRPSGRCGGCVIL